MTASNLAADHRTCAADGKGVPLFNGADGGPKLSGLWFTEMRPSICGCFANVRIQAKAIAAKIAQQSRLARRALGRCDLPDRDACWRKPDGTLDGSGIGLEQEARSAAEKKCARRSRNRIDRTATQNSVSATPTGLAPATVVRSWPRTVETTSQRFHRSLQL
ncbi:hypothetical protein [Mesorhizobium sp. CCNWLW176]|uniref:hypothetical protein n=1 Tax=unclassified Mesorhizobium TaxID=325217 RepID=UPI003FA55D38